MVSSETLARVEITTAEVFKTALWLESVVEVQDQEVVAVALLLLQQLLLYHVVHCV